jgi:hypothetical protein
MADSDGVLYFGDTSQGGGINWMDPVRGTGGGWAPWGAVTSVVAQGSLTAWTDADGIHMCQLEGNCPLTLVTPTAACGAGCINVDPNGLALTSRNLVWTSVEGVFVCALPCSGAPTRLFADGASRAVLADDQYVYWYGSSDRLYRCPMGGCTRPTVLATGFHIGQLAQDSVALYFTTGGPVMMLAK